MHRILHHHECLGRMQKDIDAYWRISQGWFHDVSCLIDSDRFGCWCWPQDVWVEMFSFVFCSHLFDSGWFWSISRDSISRWLPVRHVNSRVCNQLRLRQVAHFAGPFHPMSRLNRVGPGSCGARRNPTLQRSWPVRQVFWQQLVVFSWLWFVGSGVFCWPT